MTDDPVLVSVAEQVATVTMNRPKQMNAVNAELREALLESLLTLDADRDVRVVVLTGAGRGFCSGADRDEQGRPEDLRERYLGRDPSRDLPVRLSKPLIAAVNGAVVGVGLSFALMADIRIASRTALWVPSFARLGLVAEHGIAWTLPRLVGPGRAAEILLSGESFESEFAAQIGLVQRVTEPDDLMAVTYELAACIAANSPRSIEVILSQLRRYADLSWAEAIVDARARVLESLSSPDFLSAVEARRDGRAPTFE